MPKLNMWLLVKVGRKHSRKYYSLRYLFRAQFFDFGRWMKKNTILDFLDKYHDIKMSKRTLLNRLKEYGLTW